MCLNILNQYDFTIFFLNLESVKRTHLGLNVIATGVGLVDATPSSGDTVNTSSSDRAKKRSGPIHKIKKIVYAMNTIER